MHPAAAGILEEKTITCAMTSPKTMAFQVKGKAKSILHGELTGMITSVTAAESQNPSNNEVCAQLYSDHLNTAQFIEDHKASSNTDARLIYAREAVLQMVFFVFLFNVLEEYTYVHNIY